MISILKNATVIISGIAKEQGQAWMVACAYPILSAYSTQYARE